MWSFAPFQGTNYNFGSCQPRTKQLAGGACLMVENSYQMKQGSSRETCGFPDVSELISDFNAFTHMGIYDSKSTWPRNLHQTKLFSTHNKQAFAKHIFKISNHLNICPALFSPYQIIKIFKGLLLKYVYELLYVIMQLGLEGSRFDSSQQIFNNYDHYFFI